MRKDQSSKPVAEIAYVAKLTGAVREPQIRLLEGQLTDFRCGEKFYSQEYVDLLREKLEKAESRADRMAALADNYDHHRQRLDQAAKQVIEWCRQEAKDRTGNAENAEFYSCVKELRVALRFVEETR